MKRQLLNIVAEFEQAIKNLPDSAEGVQMRGPNCGTVPISLIAQHGSNMSPRYWLTRETKSQLLNLIENSRGVESLITAMEAILATGELKDGTKLAPNVIEALRKGWEG